MTRLRELLDFHEWSEAALRREEKHAEEEARAAEAAAVYEGEADAMQAAEAAKALECNLCPTPCSGCEKWERKAAAS